MMKDQQIKDLANILHLNYDMPEEFAKGLAEFLHDEGYKRVPNGKWNFHNCAGQDYYKCSCCGHDYPLPHIWTKYDVERFIHFCSNCGATMNAEES